MDKKYDRVVSGGSFKGNPGRFKNSDKQAKMLLTIPVHQFINKKQQDHVINNIKKFYKV